MKKLEVGNCVEIKALERGKEDLVGHVMGYEDEKPLIKLYDEPNITFKPNEDAIITRRAVPKLVYDQFKEVSVTKEMTFDSSHKLREYDGPCAKLHGHTYKIQVSIKGQINPDTGMVIDFKIVKALMKNIIDEYDHEYLNDFMDFNTTAENMVCFIFDRLYADILHSSHNHAELIKVRLWETPTSYAEYNIENDNMGVRR